MYLGYVRKFIVNSPGRIVKNKNIIFEYCILRYFL